MNDDDKIAYCGLYCGACEIYLATKNGELNYLSKRTKIPIELLKCKGCRSDITSLYCRNCAMKKCCIQKNIFSCNECNKFPCSVLIAFENDQHPHHNGVIESLKKLSNLGKIKWIELNHKRWSCSKCNSPFFWYQLQCKKCGDKTNGLVR